MKKTLIITGIVTLVITAMSCNKIRRSPGRAYMPDMYYSRAYETYANTENLRIKGINYTGMPVAGTVARGDLFGFALKDTTGSYDQSAAWVNPLPALNAKDYLEAARLFLVNCAICHGEKLNGDGPLFKTGVGPYTAKPAALIGDARYEAMSGGTMFHAMTYGKNMMGSYASQLTTRQRWMIAHYIKEKQTTAKSNVTTAAKDSVATTVVKDTVSGK
jgi:mono/diheme cytochrome c family protein